MCAVFTVCLNAFSQTHVFVPVGSRIYFLLENAQIRGLCSPLPCAKPYSRAVVLRAIDEILSAQSGTALTDSERRIFEEEKQQYSAPVAGWKIKRDGIYYEKKTGADGAKYSADADAPRKPS
jgi:hypothetical protein